jgi:hypothetical protein
MTNVMFYHTSDSRPKVLEQCATQADAVKVMKRHAGSKRQGAKRIAGATRIEYRYKTYSIAYYVEKA